MIAAIRVGDRRWTLRLASGLEIMLPDDNIDRGARLADQARCGARPAQTRTSPRSISGLLDRVTVRLREEADASCRRRRGRTGNADSEHQDVRQRQDLSRGFRGMGYTTTIRSKRQRVVAALDIGTSKICCLIAKTWPAPDWFEGSGEGVQFEVLGFDHHRAEGLKAGMITHLDSAEALHPLGRRFRRAHGRRHRRGRACRRHLRPAQERELLGKRGASLRRRARGRHHAASSPAGANMPAATSACVLHALPTELPPRRQWRHQRAARHVRRAARRRYPRRHRRRGGDAQPDALRRALPSRGARVWSPRLTRARSP